ncbi:homeobox protein Wariai-like [Topomyia yanbarensis]|uniref:homeobox protein Wariai-like n=1 Tax=Topomyia yanbarensis TaxID=2498891 RepID=UPI00273B06CB|nr:homeobox protein Wariai-like [Topomyia yanbarensis]
MKNYTNNKNSNRNINNSNSNTNANNGNSNNSQNINNNQNNQNFNINDQITKLPSDKDLLAAAHSQFELDPMRPPIVRLTPQSTNGDGRFLKARLREPKIMNIVRLYLTYMKDQQPSICVEGMTPTSIKMTLASEGLPTAPDYLLRIFIEVYQE